MTCYYGVIGNRDHIKAPDGERRPYWHFLDKQPDGWLSSLVYKREDLPETDNLIMDCGAWSYKAEAEPMIGKVRLTPDHAAGLYQHYAPAGAMLIAPDHMLIEGVDHDARRKLNAEYALGFLKSCPDGYRPMACIHGMDVDERIHHAIWLAEIGYRYLAVGGVAARAAQKKVVGEIVSRLRRVVPHVHLHVLGLSSPNYMTMWREIGVQSADGASHFKQAFTGGAFFLHDQGRLIKYQAARVDRETGAVTGELPDVECHCKACAILRSEGVDTRRYGSNEHNMGRAAHNQNMLMEAQEWQLSHSSLV